MCIRLEAEPTGPVMLQSRVCVECVQVCVCERGKGACMLVFLILCVCVCVL